MDIKEVKLMGFINVLPILLVTVGITINTIFGIYYGAKFTVIMIKNIILIISLTTCGILVSNVLKKRYVDYKKNKIRSIPPNKYEAYIPPISDEELTILNTEEDEFYQINPADLYKKNSSS